MEGAIALDPPPPGDACHTPPPPPNPWNFRDFNWSLQKPQKDRLGNDKYRLHLTEQDTLS